MGNKTKFKQEVDGCDGCSQGVNCYYNCITFKKPTYKSNIADLKDAVCTHVRSSDAAK